MIVQGLLEQVEQGWLLSELASSHKREYLELKVKMLTVMYGLLHG